MSALRLTRAWVASTTPLAVRLSTSPVGTSVPVAAVVAADPAALRASLTVGAMVGVALAPREGARSVEVVVMGLWA